MFLEASCPPCQSTEACVPLWMKESYLILCHKLSCGYILNVIWRENGENMWMCNNNNNNNNNNIREHWIQHITFAAQTNAADTHTAWRRHNTFSTRTHSVTPSVTIPSLLSNWQQRLTTTTTTTATTTTAAAFYHLLPQQQLLLLLILQLQPLPLLLSLLLVVIHRIISHSAQEKSKQKKLLNYINFKTIPGYFYIGSEIWRNIARIFFHLINHMCLIHYHQLPEKHTSDCVYF